MKVLPVTEARFEHEGYPCVVLFMPMGYRCGYVGVPKTHPAYQKGYFDFRIDCHGGVTYAEDHLYNQDDAETWWIGFDCNHLGDAPDVVAAKQYFPEHYERMEKYGYYHRYPESWHIPLETAKSECRSIAEQLKNMTPLAVGKKDNMTNRQKTENIKNVDICTTCYHWRGFAECARCCNYIFDVGHRRPCPPGDGCAAYLPRGPDERSRIKAKQKKGLFTPE